MTLEMMLTLLISVLIIELIKYYNPVLWLFINIYLSFDKITHNLTKVYGVVKR